MADSWIIAFNSSSYENWILSVVSNNSANRNLGRVIVVPLTSNTDRIYPGEARVSVSGKDSKAMADQIMMADKVRLESRIDRLSKADLLAVEMALRVQLALPI
jgi:mRNA interferase MazF